MNNHALYKVGYSNTPTTHAITYKSSILFQIRWGVKNLRGARRFLTVQYLQKVERKLTKRGNPYKILHLLDERQETDIYYDFNDMDVKTSKGYIFEVNLTKNEYSNKEYSLSHPQEILEWKKKK